MDERMAPHPVASSTLITDSLVQPPASHLQVEAEPTLNGCCNSACWWHGLTMGAVICISWSGRNPRVTRKASEPSRHQSTSSRCLRLLGCVC